MALAVVVVVFSAAAGVVFGAGEVFGLAAGEVFGLAAGEGEAAKAAIGAQQTRAAMQEVMVRNLFFIGSPF